MSKSEQQWGRSWFPANAAFDVVELAAALGRLKTLIDILAGLPTGFPASVRVVPGRCGKAARLLSGIAGRRAALMDKQTVDGDLLGPAIVFTPVPDRHLLVRRDGTASRALRVPFVRPSADLLFDSMAIRLEKRAMAVFLMGTGQDRGAGFQAIGKRGGSVIAQHQHTSERFDMPTAASETGNVDLVLPWYDIAIAQRTLAGALGGW